MLTLIIETSTPNASLAIAGPGGETLVREFSSDRNHNASIFQPLNALLDEAGRSNIAQVIVGSGPGSYSGTRVGIAAAQGVAMALGCNAFSIPSILGTSVVQSGAHCMFIGDARRGSYWISRLGGKRLVSEPALCDESGLCSALAECERSAHLVFTFEESAKFKVLDPGCRIEKVVPHATWLWNCWDLGDDAIRHKWFSEAPQPIYLKPPHITPARTTRLQ